MIAALMMVFGPATVASADHTVIYWSTTTSPPNFLFSGNWSATDNSVLNMYVSVGGDRWRVSARAGSGNGSTNDCASNQGWLPEGMYGRNDGDANSRMEQMYKNWGNAVVQGQVWFLDKKLCSSGTTTRTELFIHSSGIEGTAWNNNWKTEGCIKVSQHARTGFYDWWASAYDRNNDLLTVSY